MLWRGRSALTLKRGTACSLSIIFPCGDRGALQAWVLRLLGEQILEKNAEILSVGKIAESARFAEEEDLSLKTADCLTERSELWMEEDWQDAGAQRMQAGNLLIPLCPSGQVFWRLCWLKSCQAFYLCVGFSESLRICLQSSYSRLCGGYRRLPSCQTYLARGQVPL